MLRLRVRGSPRELLELVSGLSGVEAETYIVVGDLETAMRLIQRAVERQLVVEVLPGGRGTPVATGSPVETQPRRRSGGTAGVAPGGGGAGGPSGGTPGERRSGGVVGAGGVGGARDSSPRSGGGVGELVKAMEEAGGEELEFSELMRLKEEALSRKLVE